MASTRTWRGGSGYLATITSPEENRCVHQLFMKGTTTEQWPGLTVGSWPRRWLGGSDVDSEGTWKWLTGPETGNTFRIPTGLNPGYNAFQTVSDACKPNCPDPTWDYVALLYLYGTHIQHNQWNDGVQSDQIGAIVEYTTGAGETARTYTTTTDSQGNYTFAGLAPGVYTVQRTVNGSVVQERVVITQAQRNAQVHIGSVASAQNRNNKMHITMTPTPTTTPVYMPSSIAIPPTMTPTP
jgi:hypothetical protein